MRRIAPNRAPVHAPVFRRDAPMRRRFPVQPPRCLQLAAARPQAPVDPVRAHVQAAIVPMTSTERATARRPRVGGTAFGVPDGYDGPDRARGGVRRSGIWGAMARVCGRCALDLRDIGSVSWSRVTTPGAVHDASDLCARIRCRAVQPGRRPRGRDRRGRSDRRRCRCGHGAARRFSNQTRHRQFFRSDTRFDAPEAGSDPGRCR